MSPSNVSLCGGEAQSFVLLAPGAGLAFLSEQALSSLLLKGKGGSLHTWLHRVLCARLGCALGHLWICL